jgi:hypothetical protein
MRVIARTDRSIDLSGIDDHTVRNLTLVTAGGVVATPQGDIVLIVNQIADMTEIPVLSSPQVSSRHLAARSSKNHLTSPSRHHTW